MVRFDDVCSIILKNREHKNILVKRAVIALIPKLAKFNPESFKNTYLDISINYLLSILKSGSEKSLAYIAVGQLAMVRFLPSLPCKKEEEFLCI